MEKFPDYSVIGEDAHGVHLTLTKDEGTLIYHEYEISLAYSHCPFKYQYVHTEYDGPEDHRLGYRNSIEECKMEIDEQIAESSN